MTGELDLRCAPNDPEGLRAEIVRRDKMILALMNQVQRNLNSPDHDFALLQTSFLLEEQVRRRTDELEQAKREVEAARNRLSAAISSISEGFALFGPDDRLLLCNEVYCKLWDLGPEAVGRTLEELLRGLAGRPFGSAPGWVEQRLANHRAATGTSKFRLPSGRYIQVRERRTRDGCIVGIYADITELAEAQAQLLRDAVENIDQGITMFDADLQLVVWNRRFLELVEMPEHIVSSGISLEAIYRHNAERGEYGDGDRESLVAERMALARQRRPHRYQRSRPNGTVLEIAGRPLPSGGFVSTYTDITERVADETAMHEKTEQLIQSNADLEQFAFAASHDLRTPLRNIVGYAQLLDRRYRTALDADADAFIGFIVDNATHMTQLLTDLLDYSTVAAQGMPLQPIPAGEAVAQAIANLRSDLDDVGGEITVGNLPTVMADLVHLVSLFQNLISNSVKYRARDRRLRLSLDVKSQEVAHSI